MFKKNKKSEAVKAAEEVKKELTETKEEDKKEETEMKPEEKKCVWKTALKVAGGVLVGIGAAAIVVFKVLGKTDLSDEFEEASGSSDNMESEDEGLSDDDFDV